MLSTNPRRSARAGRTAIVMRAHGRYWTIFELSLVLMFLSSHLTGSLIQARSVVLTNCSTRDNFNSSSAVNFAANAEDLCLTPECIHTASALLNSMDPAVEPCQDFYRYACGAFINEPIMTESEDAVDRFDRLSEKLEKQLKLRMEEPSVSAGEPKHFRLVKGLYKLCMNTTALEIAGVSPLRGQLTKLGGWPVLMGDAWSEDTFDWTDAIRQIRNAGYSYSYLINFRVSIDPKHNTKRAIILDQGTLGLGQEYLSKQPPDDEIVRAYYNYMVDIARILGPAADEHRALLELNETLFFEKQLANISLTADELGNATQLYNPMSISDLRQKYPTIGWRKYLEGILQSSKQVLTDEDVVIVRSPRYMADLAEILSKTSKRIQANYLMWRVVLSSLPYLDSEVRDRRQSYQALFTGSTETVSRSKHCVQTVCGWLPIISGAIYIKHYFNEEAKRSIAEIVSDVKQQFVSTLQEVDWMDEETRRRANDKVNAMVSHIGYPEELLDDEKLDKFHENVELSGNDYLQSILNLSLMYANHSLSGLHKPVNKTDWTTHATSAVVNAFYSQHENSLQFPAGILGGTFFNKDRPNYMNYGAIGYIIGHEMTHGFDDTGRQFDENGNLVNWWAPATEQDYLRRVRCIIEQYGNYTVREVGLKVNGIATQGENVADDGGIKLAYRAYKKWVGRNGPEKRLPGIDKTPEQLFFLSAANVWCTKAKDESLRWRVLSDEHSPEEFRVLGSFSNMPEFASAFGCPDGSRMNPVKKCSIW